MTNLQIAKWGISLAVRIPSYYVRKIGIKEGDQLEAHLDADGALNMRPATWSRKSFANELTEQHLKVAKGRSVMEILRDEARY